MVDFIAGTKSPTTPLNGEPDALTPITVTVATARKISGLGNTTLWGLIKEQKLEVVHVGRRALITYRSLRALLAPSEAASEPFPRRRSRPRKNVSDGGAS
jgi:hypothetical protein